MTEKETDKDQTTAVQKIIQEIIEKSAEGDYIYRGEPECYEKVSSNLYREYDKEIDTDYFYIKIAQRETLNEAKQYTNETDDFIIQTELQHYGGKTNLIDFTTDYLIALFFACDGFHDKNGRMILQNRNSTKEQIKQIKEPTTPKHRVLAQKSVFIEPQQGWIKPDKTVSIPKCLKKPLLKYLHKHHNISGSTIYTDLHGFVKKQSIHKSAYEKFYKGYTCKLNREYSKAIELYTAAIELKPDFSAAYNHRGATYYNKKEYDLAIQDYTKAIEIKPDYANAYHNRGGAYHDKKEYELAISDYSKVIELKPDNAYAYCDRGFAYTSKGQYTLALAISDYYKAISLEPNNSATYFCRAITWIFLCNWENAKADLTVSENLGFDIVFAFHEEFGGIREFQLGYDIALPPDIRELLDPSDLGD